MSPEFTEITKNAIAEVISHYPNKEAALLPILHLAQKEQGFISADVANMMEAERIKSHTIRVEKDMLMHRALKDNIFSSR